MCDRGRVRVFDGAEQPVGNLLTRLVLAVVDAADDPVGLGQNIVGQIKFTVFQDIQFDTLQDGDPLHPFVQLIDFLPLLPQSFGVQPVGHGDTFGMIGNRDIFQATTLGFGDHFLQRVLPVGRRGVHVKIATDILKLNQRGQLALFGPGKLSSILAYFRRKDGQVDAR